MGKNVKKTGLEMKEEVESVSVLGTKERAFY